MNHYIVSLLLACLLSFLIGYTASDTASKYLDRKEEIKIHIQDHPIVAKDRQGFYWVNRDNDCYKCHQGRWNQSSGPYYVTKMQYFDKEHKEYREREDAQ